MENKINIGDMDTLVTVQECVITTGSVAQKRYELRDHSRVWAKLERNVDESVQYGNLDQGESGRATIYKIAALTTRWRIVIGDESYAITGIDPISRYSPLCVLTLVRLQS